MLHEMAHVHHRHGMRSIFQSTGIFILVSVTIGDFASLTSLATALPTLLIETGYSRDFEKEADMSAGKSLIENKTGTKPYQDILKRLTENVPEVSDLSFISTHPLTRQRIENLKALEESKGLERGGKD